MAAIPWVYNPAIHRYQNGATGAVLDPADVRVMRDTLVDAMKVISKALANRYTTGDISLGAFARGMADITSVTVTASYLLGRGGVNAMTPSDWSAAADRIAVNDGYLQSWLTGTPLADVATAAATPIGQLPTGQDTARGEYDVTPGDWVDYIENPDFDDLQDMLGVDEDDDLSDLNYDYEDDFDNEMGDYEPFADETPIQQESQDRRPDQGEQTDESEYKSPEEEALGEEGAAEVEQEIADLELDAGAVGIGEANYLRHHPEILNPSGESTTESPADASSSGDNPGGEETPTGEAPEPDAQSEQPDAEIPDEAGTEPSPDDVGTPDEPLDASPTESVDVTIETEESITVTTIGDMTDLQIEWRASLYADIGIVAYGEGQMSSAGLDLPILPGDGQTVCSQNCRCHLRFDVDESDEENPTTDIYWETEMDKNVCDDCAAMGDDWNPLTVDGAFTADDVG